MKDIFRLTGILFAVTLVAAAALSSVNSLTKPKIEEQRAEEAEAALTVALPHADKNSIVPVMHGKETLYYRGYASSKKERLVGYAIVAKGDGYSSTIETMVGVDTSFAITGTRVLFQQETPGLGTKIAEVRSGESIPYFQAQFLGRKTDGLAVDKDGGEIVSIVGATISSRAMTNSIVAAVDSLRHWLEEETIVEPQE